MCVCVSVEFKPNPVVKTEVVAVDSRVLWTEHCCSYIVFVLSILGGCLREKGKEKNGIRGRLAFSQKCS